VSRHYLACVDPQLELGRAATPVERRAAIVGERPVQEDGRSELLAEPPGDGARDGNGDRGILTSKRHDRDDVGSPDPWVNAVVAP